MEGRRLSTGDFFGKSFRDRLRYNSVRAIVLLSGGIGPRANRKGTAMKLQRMNDGRVAISDSVPRWGQKPTRHDDGYLNHKPPLILYRDPTKDDDPRVPYARDILVGDAGCLVEFDHELKRDVPPSYLLYADERGYPGNLDGNMRELLGWRGTTNGVVVTAMGWRRVESIRLYRGGWGWRVVLSAIEEA